MKNEIKKELEAVEKKLRTGKLCKVCGQPLIMFEEDICTYCGG